MHYGSHSGTCTGSFDAPTKHDLENVCRVSRAEVAGLGNARARDTTSSVGTGAGVLPRARELTSRRMCVFLRERGAADGRLFDVIITVDHVTKTVGERVLFKDAFLRVGARDRIALVGPNGAGKTTLLEVIAGEQDAR